MTGRRAPRRTVTVCYRRSGRDWLRTRHFELVTKAARRLDIKAGGEMRLNLPTKTLDVDVDGLGRAHEAVAPGNAHQLVPAEDAIGVLHQGMQEGQLARCQGHPVAVDQGVHLLQVEGDLANRDVLVLPALAPHLFGPPQQD